ncbi:hypothetical protein C2G38_2167233 [Gigaspora rosea]|uniref:Uncharacterized protein n=1 Tax=Gigaspora rosea TaxID=44941 RepID=A0A397VU80_9GLOM|nr:hypothetical protein C2G38_2167233 [Gigaspora rosea]
MPLFINSIFKSTLAPKIIEIFNSDVQVKTGIALCEKKMSGGSKRVKSILSALCKNTIITSLNLSSNMIFDKGTKIY